MTNSLFPSGLENGAKARPIFRSLHKEIDRVFDEFRELISGSDAVLPLSENGDVVPRLNILESESDIEISAELPGVKEDDVEISVVGNLLILKGEKFSEKEECEGKDYKLVERFYGNFSRTVPFNFDIDPETVEANFTDGVLTVKVTKPDDAQEKVQKIQISKAA